MGKKTERRDHLCKIFDYLHDENKEKIVRLAEGLLQSQKMIKVEKKEDIEGKRESFR